MEFSYDTEDAMTESGQKQAALRLAGYAALIKQYGLDVIPETPGIQKGGLRRVDFP